MPYGSNRTHWAPAGDISDYKFTDQELDTSTNLYNYDARLYDPVTGRFISPDSMIPDVYNPQSLNRYSYCLNNPLIYTDPSGHFVLVELGVVVLLAGFGLLSGMAMLQNDTLKLPDFGFGYDPYDPVNVKPWSPADNNAGDDTKPDQEVADDAGTTGNSTGTDPGDDDKEREKAESESRASEKTGKKARDSGKNEPHVKADQRAHQNKLQKAEKALKEHQEKNRGTKGYGKIEKELRQKINNIRQEIEKGHHSQRTKKR